MTRPTSHTTYYVFAVAALLCLAGCKRPEPPPGAKCLQWGCYKYDPVCKKWQDPATPSKAPTPGEKP
jgi:hypothetical protein